MGLVANVIPGIDSLDPAVVQAIASGNIEKDKVKNKLHNTG